MGCFSLITNGLAVRVWRGPLVLVLLCASLLLLATSAQAQNSRLKPRAGSNFSAATNSSGQTSRRPYRRRQAPVGQPVLESDAQFDYRLEPVVFAENAMYDVNNSSTSHGREFAISPAMLNAAAVPLENRAVLQDYLERASVETVGYCEDSGDSCCGSCPEPGCGCEDDCEPGCGCDDYCEPSCGCDALDDSYCGGYGPCGEGGGSTWSVGFEWSFVKPRYSENVAFTTLESDGNNNSMFADTEFDYDLELSPRVWVEAALSDCWSWRISYWQFDHAPAATTTSPNANTFGEITHPGFRDVDISTTIPTDTFTASSSLNAYSIDLEALKSSRLSGWQLGVGGGLRYASVEQNYFAQLRNTLNVLRGQIDFTHELEGFGPTISLSAKRPLMGQVKLVCAARGSLLFGDGLSRLDALEDTAPSTTISVTNRDDLLSIAEARVGLEWLSPKKRRSWQWLLSTAIEGQTWGNAGNGSSEAADLGFFGFNVGAGFLR